MNRYALGTVLGTTLLGLAKSKLGSGVRLKVQEFLQIKMNFGLEFNPDHLSGESEDEELDDAERIVDLIINQTLQTKNLANGSEITDIRRRDSFYADGHYGPETHVRIDIYVTIKKPEEDKIRRTVDEITIAVRDLLYSTSRTLYNGPSVYLPYDPLSQVKKLIVDSETGEPYKSPTPSETRLRKR